MKFFNKKFNLFILAIVAFVSFEIGVSKGQLQKDVCPPEDVNFSLFWEAYNKLENEFVKKDLLNDQTMLYGAIKGMTASLNDPYTLFFSPDETKSFLDDIDGHFEGVGMEIGIRDGQLKVIAPLEGTPAQKAGFMAGDEIISIDGKSTADLTVYEAVKLIRGPKDTDVVLTIQRDGWKKIRDISVTRGIIKVPSLKWKLIDNNIAYIELYQFSKPAANDFKKAAYEIMNSGADRIIIDLRNNPGGYLDVSREIAGWFLNRNDVVVIERFRDGQEQVHKAQGNGLFKNYKVVVLINKGSASASEILAGALRDNRNILLVGEKSFGKGSVQQLENLTGGSSLKITIAEWLTPNKNLINHTGLEPDVKVGYTEEDYLNQQDPQLDKAVEVIKKL